MRTRSNFMLAALAMAALAGAAPAGAMASQGFLPLSGRAFADVYVPTNNNFPDNPFEQLTAGLWLETDPHFNDHTYAKIVYQGLGFDANKAEITGNTDVTHLESTLREAYASFSGEGWEVRAGQQIIPWGKADVFNPTDFNSAMNLSFFNPDSEVQRVSSTSLWVSVTPSQGSSPWNFTAVWSPVFAQGQFLIPPILTPPNVTIGNPQAPPVTFDNGEVSAKVAYTGEGWDASLSAFNGWSHMPELQEVSQTVAGPVIFADLTQVYRRNTALGADGSYNLGHWVFRGESAYIVTPNNDGTNPLTIPTHWDTVLGAERPLGNNFRVQGQVLIRYFPRYTPPSQATGPDPVSTFVNQQIAAANALLEQYQDPTRPGGTLRISYTTDNQLLTAEIFFLQNFAGGDYLLAPKIDYAWTDLFKTSLGANLYGGPVTRPLGALTPFSAVYLEARYTF